MFNAATTAVRQQAQSDRSAHGISNKDVYADAPNFWRYWWEQARHTPGPENQVVDRTALWQIFATLAPRFQKTLLALATHDDHDKAAAALGVTRATYFDTLCDARQAFYRLWHQGERPSQLWVADRRGTKKRDGDVGRGVMHSIVRRRKRMGAKKVGGG